MGTLMQGQFTLLQGHPPAAIRHRIAAQNRRLSLRRCCCRASSADDQQLSLHVGETTISFPFKPQQAQAISSSIKSLLETFAAKQKAERPKRWDMMEYRYKGDPDGVGVEYLEVFCNPNAYSTPFDAKLLVTLATQQGIKVTTEARLSAIKSDIDQFIEAHA